MIITECTKCHGKVEYLSELYVIPDITPPEAGFEGICLSCDTRYYHKFKQYETEVTVYDEYGLYKEKQIKKI